MSRTPRDPLGGRFWKAWTASGISALGDGVRMAALPLAAAAITRNPIGVSAVAVAEGLPWALFALVSGALVDRLDRRRVMVITDFVRFVVMGTLALAVATHHASIPLLCVIAFALGTAQTMFDNASQAILPAVVTRDHLQRANSRLASAQIVSEQFAGPPLGALLFAAAAALPFVLDSASFLVAALIMATLAGSYRVPREGPARPLHHEIREGLVWLWHHRLIRGLALMLAIWNLFASATAAVMVLFALETLHLRTVGYGLLFTAAALGGLLGSLVATRLIAWLGPARMLAVCVLTASAAYLGVALTSTPVVVGALLMLEGLVGITWNVVTVSARQAIIPTELFGRVNSVYRFLSWGVIPIGAALGGALAKLFGLRAPFVAASLALVLMLLVGRRVVTQRAFDDAYEEAERRHEPAHDQAPS